jgi:hypothetical protein
MVAAVEFVLGQRRRFAGGAARHQAGDAGGQLPVHQRLERRQIQLAVAKRSHQGRVASREHSRFLMKVIPRRPLVPFVSFRRP